MEDTRELLGKRIRTLRQLKRMTQQQLGGEADMNYKYLGAVERGERNLSVDNLGKIAKALKVDLRELFIFEHETDDPKVLKSMINGMVKEANEKDYGTIYRVIKAIIK